MVVAVHGNGGGAHRFARVEPLMPPDVALVAVTLPGFADLPADPRLRSLADYATCLARTIEPLPRPRIVLGHGIGGSIALELVRHRATLLDGLILHAPVGARLERRIFPRLMALPGARALGQRLFSSRPLRPIFRRLLFTAAVPPHYLDRFFQEYRTCAVFSQMFDLITPVWFQGLGPSDLPAALLWGEAERLLTVDQVDDYRALLPRAIVRRVPAWGHFPMIEQPGAYAAAIAALARTLIPPTPTLPLRGGGQDRGCVSPSPTHRDVGPQGRPTTGPRPRGAADVSYAQRGGGGPERCRSAERYSRSAGAREPKDGRASQRRGSGSEGQRAVAELGGEGLVPLPRSAEVFP
jgi:pimeloyl-ACP methyl ester carboxylesterase